MRLQYFFDQSYLKKEYRYIILIFSTQMDISKKIDQQTRFDVRYCDSHSRHVTNEPEMGRAFIICFS